MDKNKPSEQSETDLQNPQYWSEEIVEHQPVKSRRAVVSIAFSAEEFSRITNAAKEAGKKTSEFIREAALATVEGSSSGVTTFRWSGFQIDGMVILGEDVELPSRAPTDPTYGKIVGASI